jgi:hypothetical protein
MSDTLSQNKIIEHLTKEIEVLTSTVMSFRTRVAFTVWVGPYILLGSLIIATKANFVLSSNRPLLLLFVSIVAVSIYLSLGWAAGMVEQQAWKQCNKWRRAISMLGNCDINNSERLYEEISFSGIEDKIKRAYMIVFILILFSFLSIAYITANIQVKPLESKGMANPVLQTSLANSRD